MRITDAHALLRAALSHVRDAWRDAILEPDDGNGPAWTPRHAVQHALAVELMYATVLDGALHRVGLPTMTQAAISVSEAWDERLAGLYGPLQLHLRSADDARVAIDEQGVRLSALFARVAHADLEAPADLWDEHLEYLERHGYEAEKSVAGLMRLVAAHCSDHARQLANAPGP